MKFMATLKNGRTALRAAPDDDALLYVLVKFKGGISSVFGAFFVPRPSHDGRNGAKDTPDLETVAVTRRRTSSIPRRASDLDKT